MEIESEEGKGTVFRIRLPAEIVGQDVAPEGNFDLGRSVSVLVVDDEPISRDVISRYLMSDGHSVVTAINAHEALERMKSESFDLLITDHAMPGMNGIQFAATVRRMQPDQPILLVTGFDEGRVDASTFEGDVDLVMRKPVPRSDLRRALVSILGAGAVPARKASAREDLCAAS